VTDGPDENAGFFMVDPEEIKAAHDRQRMTIEMISRGIDSMVEFLATDKEHLLSFKWLMESISHFDNVKLATKMEGTAEALLKYKFDACTHCGQKHSELKPSEGEQKSAAATVKDEALLLTPEGIIEEILSNEGGLSAEWIDRYITRMDPHPPREGVEMKMMKLYNLDDLWERTVPASQSDNKPGEGDFFVGFVCKSCGQFYRSIQDRMLRGTDECRGCWTKAAHG